MPQQMHRAIRRLVYQKALVFLHSLQPPALVLTHLDTLCQSPTSHKNAVHITPMSVPSNPSPHRTIRFVSTTPALISPPPPPSPLRPCLPSPLSLPSRPLLRLGSRSHA
eukprot:2596288-Rhodomonas_salina.2